MRTEKKVKKFQIVAQYRPPIFCPLSTDVDTIRRTQVKMYKEIVEIFLLFVGVIPAFLIAVIGRTIERYASERVETRTSGAWECTT